MSDNAFGIQPEQKMVNLGYATRLSAFEMYGQELRDKAQAKEDKAKAEAKYKDALDRANRLRMLVIGAEPGRLQRFAEDFVDRHSPDRWEGERFYYPTCNECVEPSWDGGEYADWPCDDFKALERVMYEYR